MSLRAPLWQQLAAVWAGAVVLSALLIYAGIRRTPRFFWLIPYPSSPRAVWSLFTALLREQPLLAGGAILVPALAVLATLVLVLARLIGTAVGAARGG